MTIDNDQGKKIYENRRVYMPQSTNELDDAMVYGPTHKLGLIRDTSIQPFMAKVETFEASVPQGAQKLRVTVDLNYQLRPGDIYPIHLKTMEILIGKK
ncbi:MAG: hypothetical protein K9N10_02205 [Deltaproteobacteria bacterium]|nr:hypothetical protein [Deltaproteobacteria bacterium]